ncbi:uncharacterized protein ACHE_41338S [Aspergillus chevalieri]|uniref:Carboxymuconolactone decarboxylase-like domain-containing protein n=1 Tax=Aspergillus chevalieri TaxID=182096 RepID=A0A7R7ZNQ2_ASPCH|nr:uncharacterized protein ACHE_41338S [Aspergillus chevalieri]BCR88773.1 hypothetical protein ACHE_41338S [Aspergillus chevalieri]
MTVEVAYQNLFQTLESRFQSVTSIDASKWPILAMATLVAGPDPDQAHNLYLYLLNQPEYNKPGSEARKVLIRRLRETLFKAIPLVGVCKPIEAILAISNVEREEDREYTFTRENWQCDAANHGRAIEWFQKLYAGNSSGTLDLFRSHRDFAWLSTEITYGLFLSDRQVLDDVDTQLVVLPGIMSQNLKTETHWHIRGTRRLGVPKEDVQVIWDCVQLVAEFFGIKLNRVPTVDAVEPDV